MNKKPESIEQLLTVGETAKFFKCAPSTVYSWIENGALPAVKILNPGARGERKKHLTRIKLSDARGLIERSYQA